MGMPGSQKIERPIGLRADAGAGGNQAHAESRRSVELLSETPEVRLQHVRLCVGQYHIDSLYVLQSLLRTSTGEHSGNGDSNRGRYSNARMDDLIDRIKIEADMKKRDGLIREALLISAAELPLVPYYQPIVPWAVRKNLDVAAAPNNVPYFFRFRVQ